VDQTRDHQLRAPLVLLPVLHPSQHHLYSQWDQSTPDRRNLPQDPDDPDSCQELGIGIVASQAAGRCPCHSGHRAVDSAQDCEVEDSEWGGRSGFRKSPISSN
jgi:hypothetical protein